MRPIIQRSRASASASRRGAVLVAVSIVALSWSGAGEAQDLTPEERQAAAEAAYDRGSTAYREGDYSRAARWYESANEMAPSAHALIQAIRSHRRADNDRRAATLAVELVSEYGEDRMGEHAGIVERVAPEAYRLDVRCEAECELQVDGQPETYRTFFLTADTQHVVVARFPEGEVTEQVRGGPGEQQELVLEPPEPEEPEAGGVAVGAGTGSGTGAAGGTGARTDPGGGGISPAYFVVGLLLTAGAGGVAIWSGLDTLDAAEDYENMPTHDGLQNGRDLELRTNVLIAAAAGLGTATLIFALVTDWSGDDGDVEAALVPLPEGGLALSARGTLP